MRAPFRTAATSSQLERLDPQLADWLRKAEALPPSNPQAHFGPALVEKLAPLFATKNAAKSNAAR